VKERFDNPDEPMQIFTRNAVGDFVEQDIYTCAHCKIVYKGKKAAYDCCRQYKCTLCGSNVEPHWAMCRGCMDSKRLAEATEIAAEEYTGPVYDDAQSLYYESLEDYLDAVDKEAREEFVFACTATRLADTSPARLASDIVENLLEHHHEDAAVVDYDGLVQDLKIWLAQQTAESWDVNYKKKIRVRDE